MESGSFLQRAAAGVAGIMDSRRVYGDRVDAHNRTVIPVSTAWWCGGGGGGEGTAPPDEGSEEEETRHEGSGGGFGGFGRVVPVGYIVLEEGGAKWKRIIDFDCLVPLGVIVLLAWLRVLRYWIRAKLDI
ncbi:MAG: hypothetical protein C4536_02855 [Actinobacteria bacterium]|jgi:uncharacterized spore protein YtfJ|nr:MAG: hypothetical protein C4536_02855 [Actinomycetota bacterium]